MARRRKRIALPPLPGAPALVEPPIPAPPPAPLIDEAFITAYSNSLFEQLVAGLGSLIGGGAQSAAEGGPWRTIVFAFTANGAESWTADQDYMVVGMSGPAVGSSAALCGLAYVDPGAITGVDAVKVQNFITQGASQNMTALNHPLKKDTKLWFRNTTTTSLVINVYLQAINQ